MVLHSCHPHPQLHPLQMSSSLSLHTSSLPSSSPTSHGSPLSSATTSPTSTASSPPTSPFRRFHGRPRTSSPPPPPPTTTTTTTTKGHKPTSSSSSSSATTTTTTTNYDRQPSPRSNTSTNTNNSNANAKVNTNTSFRDLALFFLRRHPSKVDLALSEEQSRCEGDAVERQGLGLLEPRPVEASPSSYSMSDTGTTTGTTTGGGGQWEQSGMAKPGVDRFVMGGIVEVMQGTA